MIANRVRIAHALADENWIITGVDRTFCELMKTSEEELVGRHVLDIIHPDDHEDNQAAMDVLERHRHPYCLDKRYVRPDGQAVPVRSHVSTINQGGRRHFVAAATRRFDRREQRSAAVFSALDQFVEIDR